MASERSADAAATIQALPNDVGVLKTLIVELAEQVGVLGQKLRVAEHNAEAFRKLALGPKTERRKPSGETPGQGHLFLEELKLRAEELAKQKSVEAAAKLESGTKPAKRGGRRKKYPPNLPHVRTTIELPPEQRECCGEPMEAMGEEVSRELERIETFLVHEIARKKYCCRKCQQTIVTAPGPDRVIDKGMLGVGLLAHTIHERFAYHMPYYRQEKKYAGEGVDLSRVVLCQSTQRCAELLEPIYRAVGREVLISPVIHTDETRVTEIQSREGGRRTARMWVYADKTGRCFYDFTETRERDGPLRVLGDFRGYLQADAYSGFDILFAPDGAKEVACWAHVRRKFVDAESTDPVLSKEAVDHIRGLYEIERVAREKRLDPDAIAELRRSYAVPILETFRAWLELKEAEVLPKSPAAAAIRYALNQWEALTRYPECGLLEIDNNRAERALRGIAVGRKNWLHVINETGGRTAAIFYTLIQTCKEIGIDAKLYLQDVLLRIARCSDVTTLTPDGWKEHWLPEVLERQEHLHQKLAEAHPATD